MIQAILGDGEQLYAALGYGPGFIKSAKSAGSKDVGKDVGKSAGTEHGGAKHAGKPHPGLAVTSLRLILYDPEEGNLSGPNNHVPGYLSIPYRQVTGLRLAPIETASHATHGSSRLIIFGAFTGFGSAASGTDCQAYDFELRGARTALAVQNLIIPLLRCCNGR